MCVCVRVMCVCVMNLFIWERRKVMNQPLAYNSGSMLEVLRWPFIYITIYLSSGCGDLDALSATSTSNFISYLSPSTHFKNVQILQTIIVCAAKDELKKNPHSQKYKPRCCSWVTSALVARSKCTKTRVTHTLMVLTTPSCASKMWLEIILVHSRLLKIMEFLKKLIMWPFF